MTKRIGGNGDSQPERKIFLEEHKAAYVEYGGPLWLVWGFSDDGKSLDVIVVAA